MDATHAAAGPELHYQSDLAAGVISSDPAQLQAVAALELRHRLLVRHWQQRPGLLQRFIRQLSRAPRGVACRGLYLWGGVGRGKTYLMDLFFRALPGERKLRMHFHRFMQLVHRRLAEAQGRSDPLVHVAGTIAAEADVLCFDEFFVSDIGDAMILANLLEALLAAGVMLVATSNIEPQRLYERGLQRQRFLPAIALLERHTEVLNIDGGIDYRLRSMDRVPVYLWPCDEKAMAALGRLFDDLTRGLHVEVSPELEIEGRQIRARRCSEGVVWFDFAALCRGPRGAADYIELARQFHTVFIDGLPCFAEHNDDEARRFITLTDEFYDHGVKLILAADRALSDLYAGRELRFPFERTRSRLLEMQTRDYLAAQHRPN